jgi:hypothetical protein
VLLGAIKRFKYARRWMPFRLAPPRHTFKTPTFSFESNNDFNLLLSGY